MSDADQADQAGQIGQLQADNMRLRRLLNERGAPSTLRHQVRNALGLMRAIMRRSATGKTSVADFVAHLEGRFDALLRVQTGLLSSPDGQADLAMIVADEFLVQAIQEGERATVQGPAVRIEPKQAELLGLVLHELTTNAIKFGALTAPGGHIDVSWTLTTEPERSLTLVWAETGQQRAEPSQAFRGFGMEVIEGMLPYQLKAETALEFLTEGVRCTIAMPLPFPT
ncbi:HWE histidine kinase domain-containing protein [Lichenihabitans sp. Uapishka_5]|uniref:HWE histidine kinase domain-containing protein n=1 Tax=Lichenihabitans sp. Uapishka_5 TaxID=3037302 RepID=UPI0029E7F21B|nr:HWE histidine kinase domain-containing protein [Lichenihabitans sp. Uapishka_5]MDX7950232.1 HWE histidine kinase domain-containing protein [Lichenihabitans sp. Uapishka_5]